MPQTATQIHHRNELNRQARTFLSDFLAGGPQSYATIKSCAAEQHISFSSLLTAKRSLHVESRTIEKRVMWHLPQAA
jgi:hypothetical protein